MDKVASARGATAMTHHRTGAAWQVMGTLALPYEVRQRIFDDAGCKILECWISPSVSSEVTGFDQEFWGRYERR